MLLFVQTTGSKASNYLKYFFYTSDKHKYLAKKASLRLPKALGTVFLEIILFGNTTVQPARNLHLNTRHRDLPQRVR